MARKIEDFISIMLDDN